MVWAIDKFKKLFYNIIKIGWGVELQDSELHLNAPRFFI